VNKPLKSLVRLLLRSSCRSAIPVANVGVTTQNGNSRSLSSLRGLKV